MWTEWRTAPATTRRIGRQGEAKQGQPAKLMENFAIPDCVPGMTHQSKPTYKTARILSFPTQLPSYSFPWNYALQRSTFLPSFLSRKFLPLRNSFLYRNSLLFRNSFSTKYSFLSEIPSTSKFLPLQNFLPSQKFLPNFPSLEECDQKTLHSPFRSTFHIAAVLSTATVTMPSTAVPRVTTASAASACPVEAKNNAVTVPTCGCACQPVLACCVATWIITG